MRNILGILSETLCLAFALAVGANAQGGSFLRKGDRWVLVGDSITQTDTYRQILQLAIDHYHPDADILIGNRGVWGQRLDEEKSLAAEERPQIVSIMLAMNSFIHREYGAETDFGPVVRKHVEELRARIREFKARGAEVLLMTPTLTDAREGGFFVTYNARPGLEAAGRAIRALAHAEGCFLIPVAEEVEAYKARLGPLETFIPDGVHPYGYGQYAIANAFIRRMDFAGELGGGRCLSTRRALPPLDFSCKTRFLARTDEPIGFAAKGVKGRIRWSAWCDSPRVMSAADRAGHCLARGEGTLTGEADWQLTLPPAARELAVGERVRLLMDITPSDGISRLFCLDLARVRVVPMKDGEAKGRVVADRPRREGPDVCSWRVWEDAGDLWLEGFVTADEFPVRPTGMWGNAFGLNGLQLLFDFRPRTRFAGVNPDRDAPMVLLSVLDEPRFSVLPFVWMGRRYQAALFASAEKCAGGYRWTLGFRGNVTDCERFDVRTLDCFGMQMLVADFENGRCARFAETPYRPADNPERRMNQMTIFDRKGLFKGDAVTTVNFFAF